MHDGHAAASEKALRWMHEQRRHVLHRICNRTWLYYNSTVQITVDYFELATFSEVIRFRGLDMIWMAFSAVLAFKTLMNARQHVTLLTLA